MIINPEQIKSNLREQYKSCSLRFFSVIDSTNNEAKRGEYYPGSVIIAAEQSAGRGRLGKSFHSPLGSGIYMSIIVNADSENLESMTVETGKAVIAAIEKVTAVRAEKRRINDIYYRDKKICGILCEGIVNSEKAKIEKVVIGIGLNILEPDGGFPGDLEKIASALFCGNEEADANLIAAEIINEVLALYGEK